MPNVIGLLSELEKNNNSRKEVKNIIPWLKKDIHPQASHLFSQNFSLIGNEFSIDLLKERLIPGQLNIAIQEIGKYLFISALNIANNESYPSKSTEEAFKDFDDFYTKVKDYYTDKGRDKTAEDLGTLNLLANIEKIKKAFIDYKIDGKPFEINVFGTTTISHQYPPLYPHSTHIEYGASPTSTNNTLLTAKTPVIALGQGNAQNDTLNYNLYRLLFWGGGSALSAGAITSSVIAFSPLLSTALSSSLGQTITLGLAVVLPIATIISGVIVEGMSRRSSNLSKNLGLE